MRALAVAALGLAAAGLGLGLGFAAPPAWAQSKRYPPEPVDKDREKAQESRLWEAATNPQRTPYGKLVHAAEQALRAPAPSSLREARKKLDEAIALLPDEPKALRLRGDANLALRDWARCAADYRGAWALVARDRLDATQTTDLRRKLGVCQARAGQLADAERTLAEAALTGHATAGLWVRLGEVRIAMGKLDEAIAALESAADQSEPPVVLIRWLLAGAYDRARKPAQSIDSVRLAHRTDPTFAVLRADDPTRGEYPLLGAGEADYLQGLAYARSLDQPRPEYAQVYFRHFLEVATASPWRRRAEEHLRELRSAELPEWVDKKGGAPLEVPVARAAIRRSMAAMRACAARTPFVIYEVMLTKAGPRTPSTALERPRFPAPPESITVTPTVGLPSTGEVPRAELDTAVRCIEPIASRITFPPIKERDSFFRLSFNVIAP